MKPPEKVGCQSIQNKINTSILSDESYLVKINELEIERDYLLKELAVMKQKENFNKSNLGRKIGHKNDPQHKQEKSKNCNNWKEMEGVTGSFEMSQIMKVTDLNKSFQRQDEQLVKQKEFISELERSLNDKELELDDFRNRYYRESESFQQKVNMLSKTYSIFALKIKNLFKK